MELRLLKNAVPFGTVWVSPDGNYQIFEAVCDFSPGIWRVYLYDSALTAFPLGVLSPSGGKLWLRRAFSRTEIERRASGEFTHGVICEGDTPPDAGAKSPPIGGWTKIADPAALTTDEVLRDTLTGAAGCLYRHRAGMTELAVPYDGIRHITAAAVLARVETLNGGGYFILSLDSRGWPCLPKVPGKA